MANLRVDKITSTETFETTGSVQFGSGKTMKLSANSGFDLTDNDFTIECWMCMNTIESFQQLILYTVDGTEDDTVWQFDITSTQLRFVAYVSNSSEVYGTNFSFTPGTWYHIAATRTNDLIRLFVDGDLIGTHPFSATIDTEASAEINIGFRNNQGTADRFVNGHLSNIRLIKGKALYTANFKPPMKELEVTPETTLLCCQSKTDPTLEKTGKTITITGSLSASELTPGILTPVPKSGGSSAIKGSVEFTGSTTNAGGDYLRLADSDDFNFGTEDFTIEFWMKPALEDTSKYSSSLSSIIDHDVTTGTSGAWFAIHQDDKKLLIAFDNATKITTSNFLDNQGWHHVALTRSGNTFKVFGNGVQVGDITDTHDISDSSTRELDIGKQLVSDENRTFEGFLSNFRIVKGTALYTADFIPPTRELKKVPGTVLLCCQDPVDPLKEATGKTIEGHGTLYQLDSNIDLAADGTWVDGSTGAGSASYSAANNEITMQGNDGSNRGIISKTLTAEPGITYQMSFTITDAATNGKLGLDSNDGTDDILDDPSETLDMVHFAGVELDSNTGSFSVKGVAKSREVVMYFQEFGAAGTTEFKVKGISLNAIAGSRGASNFTPQLGDDRKVTFKGNTKVNSDAYFYFPTGDTVTRDSRSGRGLFGGAMAPSFNDTIDLISIPTMGNAVDFGDIFSGRYTGACSSSTRAVFGGGEDPSGVTNVMDFVTIATNSDAIEFGNLTEDRRQTAGCSSSTRGLFGGGSDPTNLSTIDFITIASKGDAQDFGILTVARRGVMSCSSPVRGVWGGGIAPGPTLDEIDYVTIASTGNALDFGNLSTDRRNIASGGCSNQVRGVFAGGRRAPASANSDIIDYITIASTGNAQDFGDLSETKSGVGACSSLIRGVFAGGYTPTILNTLEYITIASTGDAQDFGDLTIAAHSRAGCSDSHGGLG